MGRIQTLRDITTLLDAVAPAPEGSPANPKLAEVRPPLSAEAPLERALVSAQSLSSARRPELELRPSSRIIVSDDGTALAEAVVAAFTRRGLDARVCAPSTRSAHDPAVAGLVLLGRPEPAAPREALFLTQSLASSLRLGQSLLLGVTRLDGRFGLEGLDDSGWPRSAGLAGLVKTASHEWPEVACKVVDLPPQVPDLEAAAEAIVSEALSRGPIEVGLGEDGTRRLTPTLQLDPQPWREELPGLADDDRVLVTGGARGVTAACLRELVALSAGRPTLILLGRSPLPEPEDPRLAGLEGGELKRALLALDPSLKSPKALAQRAESIARGREVRGNLEALAAAGAEVQYVSLDARDAEAARDLVGRLRAEGEITGFIHGAGVLADRLIEDKTQEQYELVVGTKVAAAETFLQLLEDAPLRRIVLFASSTARFGRKGQVDYAMANETLNKLAQRERRRHPKARVLSLNWGPWEGGMVGPELEALFASEGVQIIPQRLGARLMAQELAGRGPTEVVVLGAGSQLPVEATPETELELAFERSLSIADHEVLEDHVIGGRAVLPMALMMEWMAHAALHGQPGLVLHGLDEMQILRGLTLGPTERVTLQVRVGEARKDGKVFRLPVLVESSSGSQRRLHARAEAVLGAQSARSPAPRLEVPQTLDLRTREELYSRVLFHGPKLHAIELIQGCDEDGIAAQIQSAPEPSEWMERPLRSRWLTDPLALDAAFQLMICWTDAVAGQPSLPVSFASYRQYQRRLPNSGLSLRIAVRERLESKARADIELLDAGGNLVASLRGYECVMDGSLRAAFGRRSLEPAAS